MFASIDIGSSKVCTILANVSDENVVQVLGVGVAPSLGVQRGIITDLEDAKRAVRESIEGAERSSGLKVGSAFVGISGKHISSLNNRVAVGITERDHLVTPAIRNQGLISAQRLTIPEERIMLHAIPRRYFLDGQAGIKNPVGMHGYKLEVEAHIITVALAAVQNLRDCLGGIGVKIEGLIVSPLACAESVLEEEEKEEGVIVADIGGGTTDIAVYKDGYIWYTSTLPIGGNQVTRDLATGLGIPFDIAEEELKVKHGSLMLEGEAEGISFGLRETYSVSYEDLCYIIRARVEEILRMIMLNLPRYGRGEKGPASMVLTGGTAKLPGMKDFAEEVLELPVRIGTPRGMSEVAEALDDPIYTTSLGLLIFGAKGVGAITPRRRVFVTTLSTVGAAFGRVPSALVYVPAKLLSAMGFERRRE